jgi:casein kinase 1
MTGADVAVKIGHPSSVSSRLSHEYNVYTAVAGGTGISQAFWYGKEGEHEVIVLEPLGTSLGDLINEVEFDHEKIFSYATQMVRLLYKTNDHTKTPLCAAHSSPVTSCSTLHPSRHQTWEFHDSH